MADFQNVGNFDAGVFTPKLGGVAPSGSSFTMDAAGIASGGAFLTSELEKRDPLIRKPVVGGFEAEADSTSANTVKLTGCQWGGSADANGVAELVILTRQNV